MIFPKKLFSLLTFFLIFGALEQETLAYAPLQASVQPQPDRLLVLSSAQPPRTLAAGAKVILVSGYQPSGSTVNVDIDRPNEKILLVLTSYDQVNWQVHASPSTTITGIITAGYYPPTVKTSVSTQGYLAKNLPYVTETENANFKNLLSSLNSSFGIRQIDVFRGSYSIPNIVSISGFNPSNPTAAALSINGPSPQRPSKNFDFNLVTNDFKSTRWSLTGPTQNTANAYNEAGKIATSGSEIYQLEHDNLLISDRSGASHQTVKLPANFPAFSWAMDIAYDTKRNIVSVVSLGGEGFIYRFDARRKQWIDYKSLQNIDLLSLSYDPSMDRYVAWTQDGKLLFLSAEGKFLFRMDVLSKLTGFSRLYDSHNRPTPRVTIAPNGNDIALIYIDGAHVKNIWYYNIANNTAVLTYQN